MAISKDKNWWRQAVIYQIYPRSFFDTDGNGLGDLSGVTSKIGYLRQLGVDAVWLSPFFPSALADGGYDVDDYRDVDPKLGSLEDFDVMIRGLHDAGIRVFVDIVPNHSSDRHEWFQAALAAGPGSRERERYIFRDGKGENGELPPTDWPSHFAPSAWTRITEADGTPGQWYCHLFAPEQPDFNWDHPDVQEDFKKTLRFWADRGVDGFRIDVAHALKKDLSEPLRSYPKIKEMENPLSGDDVLFDRNEVHEVYREWRKVFDEYDPPRVAVAEAYVRAERRVLYARPDELGQAFNFDLLGAYFDAGDFRKIIQFNISLAAGAGSSSTWVLSNHDKVRHATRYGLPRGADENAWLLSEGKTPQLDVELGIRRARAATLLLLGLPGSTYFYQGEELGLHEVADIPTDQIQDPQWKRNLFKQKGRDGCRVPLPWEANSPQFGFSSTSSHLPQPSWFSDFAVDVEENDPDSTLNMYRRALIVRKALISGEDLTWLGEPHGEILHFDRGNGWQVITNFNGVPVELPDGEVLVSSSPLSDNMLPAATTLWLKVAR